MPKPGDRANAASDSRRRRRAPVVRGPQDLVFADQIPEGDAVSSEELERLERRAAELESALSSAEELERRSARELEEARGEHRESLERARTELEHERERHSIELRGLREILDQRERELRTLVLEMGKTQGRLEVAERNLLDAGASRVVGGTVYEPETSWRSPSRWLPVALMVAVLTATSVVVKRQLDFGTSEVRATERVESPSANDTSGS
ncbi:MAG: hypothetical protein ACYTFV_00155 [Planctomycetota bacterium]|jgi:hypothetical protein